MDVLFCPSLTQMEQPGSSCALCPWQPNPNQAVILDNNQMPLLDLAVGSS